MGEGWFLGLIAALIATLGAAAWRLSQVKTRRTAQARRQQADAALQAEYEAPPAPPASEDSSAMEEWAETHIQAPGWEELSYGAGRLFFFRPHTPLDPVTGTAKAWLRWEKYHYPTHEDPWRSGIALHEFDIARGRSRLIRSVAYDRLNLRALQMLIEAPPTGEPDDWIEDHPQSGFGFAARRAAEPSDPNDWPMTELLDHGAVLSRLPYGDTFIDLPSGEGVIDRMSEPEVGDVTLKSGWTIRRLLSGQDEVIPPATAHIETIDKRRTWYEFATSPVR